MDIKKYFHIHKYTTLRMYPPRPKYFSYEWGFLLECECGKLKRAKLPRDIKTVTEMISKTK